MQYENKTYTAKGVKVGEFVIPQEKVDSLSTNEYVTLSKDNDDQRYAAYQLKLNIDGKYFTNSSNLSNPEIGDYRISFKYNDAKDVSIMGVQKGNTIEAYKAKSGYSVYELYEGSYDGAGIIQNMRDTNRIIKILCRAGGIILVIIGLLAIISPIQKLAGYVPILGSIFNGITTLAAIILGVAISIIDIAIAWIAYRPVLGIALLAVAGGLIVASILLKKKKPVQQNKPVVEQPTNNDQVQ